MNYHHESYCRKCNEKQTISTDDVLNKMEHDCDRTIDEMHKFVQAFVDHRKYLDAMDKRLEDNNNKIASLIAAINTAITEFPSNQASIYLSGIMEKLFQK